MDLGLAAIEINLKTHWDFENPQGILKTYKHLYRESCKNNALWYICYKSYDINKTPLELPTLQYEQQNILILLKKDFQRYFNVKPIKILLKILLNVEVVQKVDQK